MLFQSVLAGVAFLAAAVSAQTTTANSTIDPSTIDLTLRNQWCNAQMNTCGTLCSGAIGNNTCSGDTLDFSCTCSANGSAPGLVYYTQTMPTFICEQIFQNCITDNVGVAAAQAKCTSDEKANCGHIDPTNFTAAAATTSSSASATGTASGGSTTTSSVSTTTSSGAAATMLAVGAQYGSGLLVAGAAAAIGFF